MVASLWRRKSKGRLITYETASLHWRVKGLEGLKDILQDVVAMFEADGDADEAVADACGCPFFGGQFGVCRDRKSVV